jgi:hypothetical protein
MPNTIGPDMRQVTLFMPRSDADALLARANEAGVSRSELIRQWTWKFLDGHETEQS